MTEQKPVEEVAKMVLNSSQQIAMQIAAFPVNQREIVFAAALNAIKEAADVYGLSNQQADGWIKLQMKLVREMVAEIDVGGKPEGGHA